MLSRRLRKLSLGESFLPMILGPGRRHYEVVEDAVPSDARIVGVQHDVFGRRVDLLVESAAYAPVPDGERIPEVEPKLRTIYEPVAAVA